MLTGIFINEHFESIKIVVLKLTEIVIFRVNYIIPIGFGCFGTFGVSLFNLLYYFAWLRITAMCSIPEMRIWSY